MPGSIGFDGTVEAIPDRKLTFERGTCLLSFGTEKANVVAETTLVQAQNEKPVADILNGSYRFIIVALISDI